MVPWQYRIPNSEYIPPIIKLPSFLQLFRVVPARRFFGCGVSAFSLQIQSVSTYKLSHCLGPAWSPWRVGLNLDRGIDKAICFNRSKVLMGLKNALLNASWLRCGWMQRGNLKRASHVITCTADAEKAAAELCCRPYLAKCHPTLTHSLTYPVSLHPQALVLLLAKEPFFSFLSLCWLRMRVVLALQFITTQSKSLDYSTITWQIKTSSSPSIQLPSS